MSFSLAFVYSSTSKPNSLPAESARVVRLRRSCDVGEARDCRILGHLYVMGKGVARDPVRAASLYRKACEGGDHLACRPEVRR